MNWNEYFIRMAFLAASKSKDPSSKVGCVLVKDNVVLSMGYNGFARGIREDLASRWERPQKYSWVEHAERNACYNAARLGVQLIGCTAYLNWDPDCVCVDCGKALIQVGVKEIIGPNRPFATRPSATVANAADFNFSICKEMMSEAGIVFKRYDIELV